MHKCTIFSASRLFHRFLMSARYGSTRYHNAVPNKISLDCTSEYLDGLMQSIITHCWGIANFNTLLNYNLSSSIVELWSILVYCCQLSRNVVDSQSESSNTSPNSAIKNRSNSITNRQPNTYMYLYGHKFKIIAVKGNPVDQWSCKSFSEMIDEYQVYKTVP